MSFNDEIDRLNKIETQIHRTDEEGTIEMIMDGSIIKCAKSLDSLQ